MYTDGSMTTEGVGFVVPQLSNLTRKYQLLHVSIFTAELVAILMALNFFNDLCQPPMAVFFSSSFFLFLFSDSLSALQAIKHSSQSSREDVVKEIVVVCHQLITRGTDIVLQWVPCILWTALTGTDKISFSSLQRSSMYVRHQTQAMMTVSGPTTRTTRSSLDPLVRQILYRVII